MHKHFRVTTLWLQQHAASQAKQHEYDIIKVSDNGLRIFNAFAKSEECPTLTLISKLISWMKLDENLLNRNVRMVALLGFRSQGNEHMQYLDHINKFEHAIKTGP